MRGGWTRRCAEEDGRRAIERIEKGKGQGKGQGQAEEFVRWVEDLLDLAEVRNIFTFRSMTS